MLFPALLASAPALGLSAVTAREPTQPVPPQQARSLRDALAREDAYLLDMAKTCLPTWGALMELRGEGPALDVLTWQHDRLRARGRFWLFYLWVESEVESRILMISFDAQDRVRDLSLRELDDG